MFVEWKRRTALGEIGSSPLVAATTHTKSSTREKTDLVRCLTSIGRRVSERGILTRGYVCVLRTMRATWLRACGMKVSQFEPGASGGEDIRVTTVGASGTAAYATRNDGFFGRE